VEELTEFPDLQNGLEKLGGNKGKGEIRILLAPFSTIFIESLKQAMTTLGLFDPPECRVVRLVVVDFPFIAYV